MRGDDPNSYDDRHHMMSRGNSEDMRESMRALLKPDDTLRRHDPLRRMLEGFGPGKAHMVAQTFYGYFQEMAPEYGVKRAAVAWDDLPENERELWEAVGERMLRGGLPR